MGFEGGVAGRPTANGGIITFYSVEERQRDRDGLHGWYLCCWLEVLPIFSSR